MKDRMKFRVKRYGIVFSSARASALEKTWKPWYFRSAEAVEAKRDSGASLRQDFGDLQKIYKRLAINHDPEELLDGSRFVL
jgi:hypothetical protein